MSSSGSVYLFDFEQQQGSFVIFKDFAIGNFAK